MAGEDIWRILQQVEETHPLNSAVVHNSMARRKKGEVEKRSSLLDFIEAEKPKAVKETQATVRTVAESDELNAVKEYIVSRGRVSKGELFAWAKSRGIRQGVLLRAIDELVKSGRLARRLEEGDLIYVVKS